MGEGGESQGRKRSLPLLPLLLLPNSPGAKVGFAPQLTPSPPLLLRPASPPKGVLGEQGEEDRGGVAPVCAAQEREREREGGASPLL